MFSWCDTCIFVIGFSVLCFNKSSVLQFTDWGGEWYLLQMTKIFLVEFLFQSLNYPGAFKTPHLHTSVFCLKPSEHTTLWKGRALHLNSAICFKCKNASFLGFSQDVNHFVHVVGISNFPFLLDMRKLVEQICRGSWTCAEWINSNNSLPLLLQG